MSERFPVAKFTRDNPCTKVHLHNCFYKGGKYIPRPVVEAKSEIGENAPKYLIREGYATIRLIDGVDYYVLTEDGDNYLRNGIQRYLTLHPEHERDCKELPMGYVRHKPEKPTKATIAHTLPAPKKSVLLRRR